MSDTFKVRAVRWEHGWELHIEGVGVTQSHGLRDAKRMARSYISLMLDIPEDSFDVHLTAKISSGLDDEVQRAREAVAELERLQREAALLSRAAVRDLKAAGLSGADVAAVLDVSPQRVSQLSH
jgi:hypothetical protein